VLEGSGQGGGSYRTGTGGQRHKGETTGDVRQGLGSSEGTETWEDRGADRAPEGGERAGGERQMRV